MAGLTPNARRLAREAPPRPPQGVAYSWPEPATIAAFTSGIATVTYKGATQKAAYLSSYTPAVGDTVVLLVTSDGALLVLGKPIGTPS